MRRTWVVGTALLGLVVAAPVSAAAVWTTPQAVSGVTTSGDQPVVASSPTGEAVAVWQQVTASGERIMAAVRSPGGVWAAEHPLSRVGSLVFDQQVAMDAHGDAVAVWLDSGRVMTTRRPAGGSWSTAVRLSAPGGGAHFPQVAMSPQGATLVVWERVMALHERIQAIGRPAGGHWSAVRTLSGTFGDANYPQVALDAHGRAVVGWERDWADGGRSAAFVTERSARGVWATPRMVSPTGHQGLRTAVAMNPRGDAVVAWWGRQSGIWSVQAVVRRVGGRWSPVANASHGVRASGLAGVVLDGAGNATVAWSRWDGTDHRVMATRRPTGGHWGAAVTLSPAGEDTTWVDVATAAGATSVTWENSSIEGARRPAGGAWGPVIPLSHGAEGHHQQVALDAGGHTVVVWKGFDGTHDRVWLTSLG
jgi:hypothetical protein